MKLAILHDAQRLREGGPALARLAVALLDEGLHLLRVVPDDFDALCSDPHERSIALVPRAAYAADVPWWLRIARRERLLEVLERDPPDVLYACGRGSWSLAAACSKALDCPLVIELAGADEIHGFGRRRRLPAVVAAVVLLRTSPEEPGERADALADAPAATGASASAPGATAVLHAAGAAPTVVRPGVSSRPAEPARRPAAASNSTRCPSIAIVGECTSVECWRPLLEALTSLESRLPDWHAVLELRGPAEHLVWRLLRDSPVRSRVSPIADAEAMGPLVRQCDVLVVPEASHRVSMTLLEAMAAGMPAIALADAWLPLVDERTGVVVRPELRRPGALADRWRHALESLCLDRSRAMSLGEAAARYIAAWHRSSGQALAISELVHRLAAGPALPFPGPSASG